MIRNTEVCVLHTRRLKRGSRSMVKPSPGIKPIKGSTCALRLARTIIGAVSKEDCINARACVHFEPSMTIIPLPKGFLTVSCRKGSRLKISKDIVGVHVATSESTVSTIVVPNMFALNVLP